MHYYNSNNNLSNNISNEIFIMEKLTTKHVIRLTDTQKEFLDSQGNGSEFLRSKINEESISEKVLNEASDIDQVISMGTADPNYLYFDFLVNDLGQYSFQCNIRLNLDYSPPEEENDLGYSFRVEKVVIDVENVFEDGEEIEILKTAKRKLEKTLENNLTFDIYKHINDN